MLTTKLALLSFVASLLSVYAIVEDKPVHLRITVHHRQAKPNLGDKVCLPGYTPVSVEGIEGAFCTKRDICQGFKDNRGNCPDPQDGLRFGSHCGKVKSGAYGCIANVAPPHRSQKPTVTPVQSPSKPSTGKPTTGKPTTKPPATPGKCPAGSSPVSVEGVQGAFCTKGDICLGFKNANGNCPGPQAGLPLGSFCGKVASGAFGCKPKKP